MTKKAKKSEQTKVADQMNQDAIDAEVEVEEEVSAVTVIGDNLPDEWQFANFERASSTIWRPEPGWALMGTYKSCSEFTEGDFDQVCMVHLVEDFKSGNLISFVGGAMLDKFIDQAPIGDGTRVFIRYLDQSLTKKERRVNNWDIRYDPSTAVKS